LIEIIEGDAHDIASIMPVMQSAFNPAFGEAWTASQCMALLAIPESRLLLAKNSREIVGFAISRWVLDEEEVMMIGVAPIHQRRGVASKLLQTIIKRAQISDRQTIFLEVRINNEAISFYEQLGFQVIGRRKEYYRSDNGSAIDAITMKFSFPG
jgi:[ribosomal protein S18]-alanine N-acetyltransferase